VFAFGTIVKLLLVILLDVASVHDPTNVAVTSLAQHEPSVAPRYVLTSPTTLLHVIGAAGVEYVPVVVVKVGNTLLNVYVAVRIPTLLSLSLTYHVLSCDHGCCAAIPVVAVALHNVPLKLYGVSCKPVPAPSLADVIVKLHALHSFPFALANVKVGAVASFV
jgi:hypothetical protein